jgi:hypothetical protein
MPLNADHSDATCRVHCMKSHHDDMLTWKGSNHVRTRYMPLEWRQAPATCWQGRDRVCVQDIHYVIGREVREPCGYFVEHALPRPRAIGYSENGYRSRCLNFTYVGSERLQLALMVTAAQHSPRIGYTTRPNAIRVRNPSTKHASALQNMHKTTKSVWWTQICNTCDSMSHQVRR